MRMLLEMGLANAAVATALGLLAAVVGGVARRPALTHSLWLLVLLKLITPPLVRIPIPWPAAAGQDPAGVRASPSSVEAVDAARAASDPAPGGTGAAEEGSLDDRLAIRRRPAGPPGVVPIVARARAAAFGPVAAMPSPSRGVDSSSWASAASVLWAAGSALWFATAWDRIRRFRRLLRDARPAPAALQEWARELAMRLGMKRCPGVWLVPMPISPLLWGAGGAARLVLPEGLLRRLGPEERTTLIAHELAHLRRRDNWVRWIELAALGLYWWHPVAWWARREIGRAEEECCDSWVVWSLPGSALAYAKALLKTVEFLSDARPALPPATSGAGHMPTLRKRVTMILRETPCHRLSRPARVVAILVGMVFLPVGAVRSGARATDVGRQQTGESRGSRPSVERPRKLEERADEVSDRARPSQGGRDRDLPGGRAAEQEATYRAKANEDRAVPAAGVVRLQLRGQGSHIRARIRLRTAEDDRIRIRALKETWGTSEADARASLEEMKVGQRREGSRWIVEASWPARRRLRRLTPDGSREDGDAHRVTLEIGLPRWVRLDLSEFNLIGVDLEGQDLREVDLAGLTLIGAQLARADLSGKDLSGTDLTAADLERTDMTRADLSTTNLTGSYLKGTDLAGARLKGADLTGAYLAGLDLTRVALGGVNLNGAQLAGLDLKGGDLRDVHLRGAKLTGLDLSRVDLRGLVLIGVDLAHSDLAGKDLSGTDLTGANLEGAKLAGADLTGARLTGACLKRADLTGAIVQGAELTATDTTGAKSDGVRGRRTNP
jgi:uncharacterized protein YjbI with pentapeptide repeats/beta-lactamase regulating signal transducer with metallopeptidase domain